MEPKNVILWAILPAIVVLVMSTGVQAQELREVPANDILEQIEDGEDVYLDHVYVTGMLDLNKIELETVYIGRSERQLFWGLEEELKIVESKITIKNSVFGNDVNFHNAQFRKKIVFHGTAFSCKTNFRGAIFGDDVNFMYASFGDDANFESVSFGGYANFWYASFSDNTGFKDASFSSYANFRDATFGGDIDFAFASFSDDANFEDTDFSGYADFEVGIFNGRAYFADANFSGDANFASAIFSEGASFMHATFSDDAYFWHAYFSGNTYFDSANFRGNAEFTSAEFDEVDFSNTAFFRSFILYDADFKRIKVSWTSIKDLYSFDGPTYIKLIKNFRDLEQFEDADDAYYQYRQVSQANKNWSLSKLEDVVAWFTCGYGVKPEYPLIWGVGIILGSAFIYWLGSGIRRLKEIDEDDNRVSFLDAFYFSMVTFTTLGYGDWYPVGRYRIVVIIEGLIGWLLLALFLVTLANVMIRP